MRKDNYSRKKTKQNKMIRRITSIATAAVMLSVSLPMSEIKDGCGVLSNLMQSITVHAFNSETSNPVSISSFQQLIDYSNNYDASHANDTITITFGDSGTSGELTGFTSIGTENAPFDGKIIVGSGMTLNLPTTMFSYITDDVQIVDPSGNAATLVLTRTRVTQDEPLFANTVRHTRSSGSAEWSIYCDRYYNPETSSYYAYDFAGFIGTMDNSANVKIKSLTFDNLGGNATANISSTGSSGLVCCTMKAGAVLEIDEIEQTSGNSSNNFKIESTSSGNVGGLVGTMNDGAKLILGENLANIQGSNQEIKATTGYAGGIVGSCNGGTIKFDNTSAYSIEQIVSGSSGAGGIAGYYNTVATDAVTEEYNRYTVSTKKVSIGRTCRVNGGGNCGGLFGTVNNDGDMTISGSTAVSPTHGAGGASSYGALIGKYTAVALSDSLTVSTTGIHMPTRSGGTASQFGGLIGEVSGASYVKFNGVTVTTTGASATTNFGGLVGKAANGFIELDGTNTIGYSGVSTTKTFGGVVGDFANGVIYLQGTTDLHNTPEITDAASTSGQVAGYREYGLAFAANGWTMTRSDNSQTLDDIGSWGEVVRFDDITQSDVLTINDVTGDDNEHYVTLLPAVTAMSNTTEFVKTALNIQLNNGQDSGVLRCSGSDSATLLGSSSALSLSSSSVSIELNGTGITGLTRDDGSDCVEFCGTFNGNGGKIKLATGEDCFEGNNSEGNGKIYRHAYNGLFAKTSGATIQNLNIASDSKITVNALKTMYLGNVVAQASGDLTLSSVKVCNDGKSTPEDYATIDSAGSSICIGGLVGNLTDVGTVSITDCEYRGEIKGTAASSKIGGLIGSVSDSDTFDIAISGTTKVGGKITAAAGNEVGGTIGVIDTSSSASSGRTLSLNGLTVDGLAMNVSDTCGGFLGQNWYKTDVEFTDVKVGNGATLTSSGNTAGLVHTATGYWKVNSSGITLGSSTFGDTMSVTAESAATFGLLVNKGYADDSAIYLELAPSAYAVNKTNVSLTMESVSTFDEIVAYTGGGNDVLGNGQGVVSVATSDHALLTMDSAGTGTTYQHQTAFLDSNPGKINNPHSRYYYNLDAYRNSPSAGAQQLLIWSVKQYAHKSIQGYFNFSGNTITGSMNMDGYSYYPIDLTGRLTLNGSVHLYNVEFDTAEASTTDNRLTNESAQHYLMQDGLFRNVSGTLNTNITLDGNIKKIGSYCGALVMDTVSSDAIGSPATINVNGLVLSGVNIASAAGPLLINKAGSNATLNITNVSNDNDSYKNMGAGATTPSSIATSLLGEIGSANATAVKLNFSLIKLDGRNATGVTNLPDLNDVYHSKGSLFSKSTLVDTFAYKNNSGSYGVYNYEYSDDWGGNRKVTYGAEIDQTVENRDNSTPSVSKQRFYNNNSSQYTRPDAAANVGSAYEQFGRDFQKYVYAGYVEAESKHELRVNVQGVKTKGCGTYNDPYIITSESDLIAYSRIINGLNTDSQTISVPMAVADGSADNATWCEEKNDHRTYTVYDSTGKYWYVDTNKTEATRLSNDTLRQYLAGAYYKVDPDLTTDITLSSTSNPKFEGISSNVGGKFAFRGVIDGSGKTIINQTTNPLIANSYGSVVYNLTLDVQPTNAKQLSQTTANEFSVSGGCDAYGAVMSKIFGGDNIIDNVSVKFTGTVVDAHLTKVDDSDNTAAATKAQIVPIGGYVGVVINGGLIFREMTGLAKDNQTGLNASNLTGFGEGVGSAPTNPLASDNTKWLYVNPIIGRVLNGYAVTESSSYKPFEDGTRTYPDGTVKTWTSGVTMRNGTKNYSIADIKKGDSNFTMTDSNGDTNGSENSTITVSTAQQLFIISLITESGLGTSANCLYDDTHNLLKPYTTNMATHLAEYYHVGEKNLTETNADYVKASNDVHTTIDLTEKVPYLIKNYTPEIVTVSGEDTVYTYPAFNLAAYTGDEETDELYLNMAFSGTDTTLYIPDGFRGLGALMLQYNSGTKNWYYGYRVYNAMFLKSLDGADKNVSLNMNLSMYTDDNYLTPNAGQAYLKTGYGFFNALRSKEGSETANQLKDLSLSGNVRLDLIDTAGNAVYDEAGLNVNPRPAVGGFIGAPGIDTNNDGGGGDMYLNNISLDNLYVQGARFAGGFMGCSNSGATYSFYNCSADNLRVLGGTSSGGLIGYVRQKQSKVDANFCGNTFGIISIISRSTWATTNGDVGSCTAGGLIGENFAENSTGVKISNVTIQNASSFDTGYVGYDETTTKNTVLPYAAGVIGAASRSSAMTLTDVTVKNLNIKGSTVGGMIGYCVGNYAVTITDGEVTTDQECGMLSTVADAETESGVGGLVGRYEKPANITIKDSSIKNYTLSSDKNCGGLIGKKTAASQIVCDNISINGVDIKTNTNGGGMVANMDDGSMYGYNILVDDLTFAAYVADDETEGDTTDGEETGDEEEESETEITSCGYIIGRNNDKVIKLVGYSRQGTISVPETVGTYTTNMYGSDGYVIFADYTGTATGETPNAQFANFMVSDTNGQNIVARQNVGSKTTVTNYTIVARRSDDGAISVIDVPDETAVTTWGEFDDSISYGSKQTSFSDGKRVRYIDTTDYNNLTSVVSIPDLTDTTKYSSDGFYLYIDASKYFSSNVNNNGALQEKTVKDAAKWYFEQDGTKYKVYTIVSGEKNYIQTTSGTSNTICLGTVGDSFDIIEDSTGVYYLYNSNGKRYLQHSGSGGGIRYHTDKNNNGKIKMQFAHVDHTEELRSYSYGTSITFDGTTLAGVTALPNTYSNSDTASYTQYCSDYSFTDSSGTNAVELYQVTKTVKENIYAWDDNAAPFVTTNPKCVVTKKTENGERVPSQWLTGDGVSNASYYGSAAQAIIQGNNTNKGYRSTGLSSFTTLRTELASNMTGIKSVVRSSVTYSGEDFPVLVIDDLNNADELVNGYLKLLTNTNYNFAKGYSNGTTYTGTYRGIFNVDISKWKYAPSSGEFEKQSDEPSLKCDMDRFYITPTGVDNENWQFSLIDVQFYDPNSIPQFDKNNKVQEKKEGKIAYHLYVPVVVKKMLHYSVQLRLASSTTYNLGAYPSSIANLVENLGNPVTLKVTYTYQQKASAWAESINGGESVYRNYNKTLDVKAWDDLIPSDAIVVFVDPNDNADKYYTSRFSSVLTNGKVITTGTKTYNLNLNSFSGFSVPKLNDLMTISLDESEDTTKNLVEWVEGTDSESTLVAVVNDGGANDGLKLRYKANGETGEYAVSVSLKDHQNNGEYVQENYYISIFTKENASDNNIYHYEIKSTGTNFGDTSYPSARIGDEAPHLFLGNIYTNTVEISETNRNQLMSESNLSLSANLTAKVGFTENAVDKSIHTYISNENVKIYQTFMVALNRLNGEAANQRGILVDPAIVAPTNYKINNSTPTKSYRLNYHTSSSYIELTNNCDIKDELQYAAYHPTSKTVDDETVNDYSITVTESVAMTYALSTLSSQFPQVTNSDNITTENSTIGTYMIGYSNISSTSDGGAASRASANTDGTTRLCYYIDDDTSVEFSYNAVYNEDFDGDGNGNYGQLGLDGKEMDGNGKSYVQINSAARYNTYDYNMKTSGNFVKITVKLSKKGESGETAPYTTALKISDYLTGFEILDKNGAPFETTADDPATTDVDESVTVITNSADNIYTYIVPKDMLDTLSDDEYYIPINFKAYSGNNATFEDKNMQYSNYKVLVTVGLLTSNSTTEAMLQNSDGTDHIIYTNAKIHSEVID